MTREELTNITGGLGFWSISGNALLTKKLVSRIIKILFN